MDDIIISQQDINEILSAVGYPTISLSDLEFPNEKVFREVILVPVMREYFTWFPIVKPVEYEIMSTFEIPFPTIQTFTVNQAYLNTAGFGVRSSTNPFLNNSVYRAVNNASSYGGGLYGTKNDYGMFSARIQERAERQSLIDTNKCLHLRTNHSDRKVEGWSNITGKLVVQWCEWSENFEDVVFQRRTDVKKLAKAKLMLHLGMLRSQLGATSGLPVNMNYQIFVDKGEKLEEEVLKRWKELTKTVIMKG
jgi:hypothetical protein